MLSHPTPDLSPGLAKRIRLVRRDVSDLLFHFTRNIHPATITIKTGENSKIGMPGSASGVLRKILYEGNLIGSSRWTYGENTICFTEAPIQEFNSIFSLVSIAASSAERPRYEPYGIAISKKWFFEQGGRPVIYDREEAFEGYPQAQRYRFVPYDPTAGVDFTWEREWRIKADHLVLDPKHTLVVVPTSDEAFEYVYEFANIEPDWDVEGSRGEPYIVGAVHSPKWLAVSLDMFGFSGIQEGVYRPVTRSDRLLTFFGVERARDEPPVDVWPLGLAPFIRLAEDGSGNKVIDDGLFGLLPHFAVELAAGRRTYNARSETVATLASFRQSWAKCWRCIIPAEAFYEPNWESGKAERWIIQQPGSVPMGIAGIYRKWRHPDGREVLTFAMLTVNADGHPVMQRFHKPEDEKRMVVILDPKDYGGWLSCPLAEAPRFFRQWEGPLEAYPAPLPPRAPKGSSVRTTRPPKPDAGGQLF